MFGFLKRKLRAGAQEAEPDKSNIFSDISPFLNEMGYELTPYGMGVVFLELNSGYSLAETASHIALSTLARDVKEAGDDVQKLMMFVPHAISILEIIKGYRDQGIMHPTQWQNDANAIWHVGNIDEHQLEWVERILSDEVIGKERVANRRKRLR